MKNIKIEKVKVIVENPEDVNPKIERVKVKVGDIKRFKVDKITKFKVGKITSAITGE